MSSRPLSLIKVVDLEGSFYFHPYSCTPQGIHKVSTIRGARWRDMPGALGCYSNKGLNSVENRGNYSTLTKLEIRERVAVYNP